MTLLSYAVVLLSLSVLSLAAPFKDPLQTNGDCNGSFKSCTLNVDDAVLAGFETMREHLALKGTRFSFIENDHDRTWRELGAKDYELQSSSGSFSVLQNIDVGPSAPQVASASASIAGKAKLKRADPEHAGDTLPRTVRVMPHPSCPKPA
ncbi:hypothetical protein EXIGLDRAFT_706833 [Exidia glandulosa HHB12029]|uniref:Uncharacterized protein n=1 Tax=Exidia glandulosa HHB12029 TaxID=1314781 RepID=A0A165AZC8_EXIGL|nr:hypothetical protein EXIGLDRAFT_706833 [Exidia glandulosa HHB12029]